MSIPDKEILRRFDEMTRGAHRLASHLASGNRSLAATRDLLLPRLVTGRLDISNVDLGALTPTETA